MTGKFLMHYRDEKPVFVLPFTTHIQKLIWYCLFCLSLGLVLAMVAARINLNPFGLSKLVFIRTWLLSATGVYLLGLTLPHVRTIRPTLILLLPVLTQFYQTIWGWDCSEGATSFPRLIPLLVMALAMQVAIHRRPLHPSGRELIIIILSALVCLISLFQSILITNIGHIIFFLVAILLPTCYLYTRQLIRNDRHGIAHVITALIISFFIFTAGTLLVVYLGTGIELNAGQSDGRIIYTRNVSDFNQIFLYIILLWPFTVSIVSRYSPYLLFIVTLLFISAVAVGLSRTSALMTAILVFGTIFALYIKPSKQSFKYLILIGIVVVIIAFFPLQSLFNDWSNRLDLNVGASLFDTIKFGSQSFEDRFLLQQEGIRIWMINPIVGVGWDGFYNNSLIGQATAHAFFIDILIDTGLLGFSLLGILILRIITLITRFWLNPNSDRRFVFVFIISFVVWLFTMNSLGGNLYSAHRSGFIVNVINGILLTIYLHKDIISVAVRRNEKI